MVFFPFSLYLFLSFSHSHSSFLSLWSVGHRRVQYCLIFFLVILIIIWFLSFEFKCFPNPGSLYLIGLSKSISYGVHCGFDRSVHKHGGCYCTQLGVTCGWTGNKCWSATLYLADFTKVGHSKYSTRSISYAHRWTCSADPALQTHLFGHCRTCHCSAEPVLRTHRFGH